MSNLSSGNLSSEKWTLFSEISDPNATPERKVKTINRNAFKTELAAQPIQIQHASSSQVRSQTSGDYKENYCQLYGANGISSAASSSLFMSESTEFFEKGSLITLENGDCKKIEDLNKDDFLNVKLKKSFFGLRSHNIVFQCGDISKDKRLITSVLTEINHQRTGEQYVNLHFEVSETGQKVIY